MVPHPAVAQGHPVAGRDGLSLLFLGAIFGASFLFMRIAAPVLGPFLPSMDAVTAGSLGAVVMLGLLCTALAWPILFRLVAAIGPTASSTVTFLVPAFGVAWGAIFLGEPLVMGTLAGALLVLVSVGLVLDVGRPRAPGRRTAGPVRRTDPGAPSIR